MPGWVVKTSSKMIGGGRKALKAKQMVERVPLFGMVNQVAIQLMECLKIGEPVSQTMIQKITFRLVRQSNQMEQPEHGMI